MKKFLSFFCIIALLAVLLTAFSACKKEDAAQSPTTTPEADEGKTIEDLLRETEGEHTFTYTVTVEPTESTVGEATARCADCGLTATVYLPVLNGTNYRLQRQAATCTEDGYRRYSSEYGVFEVKERALGHNYTTTTERATCTHDGSETSVCSRCGDSVTETLLQLPHDLRQTERVDGTCTTYGYTKYTCSLCGLEVTQTDKEVMHDFDDGAYVPVACDSEEKYGYTLYTCLVCGEEKKVYDEVPTHVYNKDTGACEVCGEKCKHAFDGYVCTVCGLNIEERVAEEGYFLLDDNGNDQADVGEKMYFGTYPQSIAEKETANVLKTLSPVDGYYVLDGKKYVRKTLDQRWGSMKKFSNGAIMTSYADYEAVDHVYDNYFYRVEPICWTVAATEEGTVTLRAEQILGVTEYKGKTGYAAVGNEYFVTSGNGITENHANDWSVSDLREYLNGTFFQTAFDATQRGMMTAHTLKNDRSTNYYQGANAVNADTEDLVYIDAFSEIFGEEETPSDSSFERMKTGTDYALGCGLDAENDHHPYYTRSIGNGTNVVGSIDTEGKFDTASPLFFHSDDAGRTLNGIGFLPLIGVRFEE